MNHHKEGTGLGLAISKQLMELMDDSVSVESEYGKGSTFAFVAPDATILIVDDTKLNIMVAGALMEPTKMNIHTVDNGPDAIQMVKNEDYDLIFMDHFMPGMDGVETTQHIRALEDENQEVVAGGENTLKRKSSSYWNDFRKKNRHLCKMDFQQRRDMV